MLSALLAFYFLQGRRPLWDGVLGRVRPEAPAPSTPPGRRAFEVLSGYMIGTAAISLVGAASQLLIMVILGIPLALPIFVLSFFLCFIPYIGGFISTGIAFLRDDRLRLAADIAIMVVWTLVFNIVTGQRRGAARVRADGPPPPRGRARRHPGGSRRSPASWACSSSCPVIGVVATTWRTVLAIIGMPRGPVNIAASESEAPQARWSREPRTGDDHRARVGRPGGTLKTAATRSCTTTPAARVMRRG